ncbi:MAG: TRAP transporter small permease subunit [Nitratireductor sp.]
MFDSIIWFLKNVAFGIVNLVTVLVSPSAWPNFSDMAWISKLIYYGASVEFFFIVFDLVLILLVVGLWRRHILWAFVRGSEKISNTIGRLAAWAVLIMVLQQVVIVALQRIFRVSEISIAPFGIGFTRDVSWFAEELKLYNAMIVALCAAYTFIQGGHVRVDLVYSAVSYRVQKIIDMAGSLLFAVPFLTIVWLYGWFFMWRHLTRPPLASNYDLDRVMRSSKLLKWDVETIGFSPNGFDGYFLFKILLISFAGLMFLQAITFFFRSLLEYLEGEEARDRYLDRDSDQEADAIAKTAGHGA